MPVPLTQLSSISGAVSTSASSTAVCTVTYVVPWPAVSAVPSSSAVAVVEYPRKRKRLMDPADHAWAWESFQDWWASGRSTPSTGTSSAPQLPLVTPLIDPAPGPPSALALLADAALSSSFRSSERYRSRQSPGPCPVPAPSALPDPPLGGTRTRSRFHSCTRHPSGGRLPTLDP